MEMTVSSQMSHLDGAPSPRSELAKKKRMGKSMTLIFMSFGFMAVIHRFENTRIV